METQPNDEADVRSTEYLALPHYLPRGPSSPPPFLGEVALSEKLRGKGGSLHRPV